MRMFFIFVEQWGKPNVKNPKMPLLGGRLEVGVVNWAAQRRKNGGKWYPKKKPTDIGLTVTPGLDSRAGDYMQLNQALNCLPLDKKLEAM